MTPDQFLQYFLAVATAPVGLFACMVSAWLVRVTLKFTTQPDSRIGL